MAETWSCRKCLKGRFSSPLSSLLGDTCTRQDAVMMTKKQICVHSETNLGVSPIPSRCNVSLDSVFGPRRPMVQRSCHFFKVFGSSMFSITTSLRASPYGNYHLTRRSKHEARRSVETSEQGIFAEPALAGFKQPWVAEPPAIKSRGTALFRTSYQAYIKLAFVLKHLKPGEIPCNVCLSLKLIVADQLLCASSAVFFHVHSDAALFAFAERLFKRITLSEMPEKITNHAPSPGYRVSCTRWKHRITALISSTNFQMNTQLTNDTVMITVLTGFVTITFVFVNNETEYLEMLSPPSGFSKCNVRWQINFIILKYAHLETVQHSITLRFPTSTVWVRWNFSQAFCGPSRAPISPWLFSLSSTAAESISTNISFRKRVGSAQICKGFPEHKSVLHVVTVKSAHLACVVTCVHETHDARCETVSTLRFYISQSYPVWTTHKVYMDSYFHTHINRHHVQSQNNTRSSDSHSRLQSSPENAVHQRFHSGKSLCTWLNHQDFLLLYSSQS